jgi:hypothetical protein
VPVLELLQWANVRLCLPTVVLLAVAGGMDRSLEVSPACADDVKARAVRRFHFSLAAFVSCPQHQLCQHRSVCT